MGFSSSKQMVVKGISHQKKMSLQKSLIRGLYQEMFKAMSEYPSDQNQHVRKA